MRTAALMVLYLLQAACGCTLEAVAADEAFHSWQTAKAKCFWCQETAEKRASYLAAAAAMRTCMDSRPERTP